MIRYQTAAPQCYQEDFTLLDKQITASFHDSNGPGDLPVTRKEKKILGIIVPSAPYSIAAPTSAWAYKELAESVLPKTYLILSSNPYLSFEGIAASSKDWQTPFGILKTDQNLVNELKEKLGFLTIDDQVHETNHTIEVQLPFLQFSNKDKLKEIKICALLINTISLNQLKELATVIKEKDIVVIVSSDFTKCGPLYNYTPFIYNKKQNLQALDNEMFNAIQDCNAEKLLKIITSKKVTVEAPNALAAFLEILKTKEVKSIRKLQYTTSDSITKDATNTISLASFIAQ